MNKQLFNTNPMTTGQLTEEYTKYIEETATNLVRSFGPPETWPVGMMTDLEAKAQKEAEWSSWVVSTSRRNFAYHQACFGLNADHTMGGVRPTAAVATIAIARHITKRAKELVNHAQPHHFRFVFVAQNRKVMVPDVDPRSDDDNAELQIGDRPVAMDTIRRYYKSYLDMGLSPPVIKMIGYDENNRVVEENNIAVSICNDVATPQPKPKVNIESSWDEETQGKPPSNPHDYHPLAPPKRD